MNSRKYTEEDLEDSLVLDKEGYICGYVSGFSVDADSIGLNLYGFDVKNREVPDAEELLRRLMELAPRQGVSKRRLTTKEFHDWIRESLNLSKREAVNTEHLVRYATFKNIVVPVKTEDTKVKVEKEPIKWSDVDTITFTDLGKCIRLKSAVEAKKRGIAPKEQVEFQSTDELLGKLVVDSRGEIVGTAAKFLMGSPPGMLINLEQMTREEFTDVEAVKKVIIPSKFKDEKDFSNQVKKEFDLEILTDHDLALWAKRNNINAQNTIIEHRIVVMEVPVNWDRIDRIGDVVILKDSAETLQEQVTPPIPVSV